MTNHYPFELEPLPYAYDALEPYIDAKTMELHHNKHLNTYIENLNKALFKYPAYQDWPLERLLNCCGAFPPDIQTAVHNNGGGVYNHVLYFSGMRPPGKPAIPGRFARAINHCFGSTDAMLERMKETGMSRFGSGWAVLAVRPNGDLCVLSLPNQDTVLPMGLCPVLLLDVWEHAYYLKYNNRRDDYIRAWFSVIDWDAAERRYELCVAAKRREKSSRCRPSNYA